MVKQNVVDMINMKLIIMTNNYLSHHFLKNFKFLGHKYKFIKFVTGIIMNSVFENFFGQQFKFRKNSQAEGHYQRLVRLVCSIGLM